MDTAVINATLLLSDALAERLASSHSVPYALQNAWIEQDIRDQIHHLAQRLQLPIEEGIILRWSCSWPIVIIHTPKAASTTVLKLLQGIPEISEPRLLPCRELGLSL